MKKIFPLVLLPCALLLACSPKKPAETVAAAPLPPAAAEPAPEPTPPPGPVATGKTAAATIASASKGSITGQLNFTGFEGGVRVSGEITGLAPDSEHGIHIHELGDCSAKDAKSAGDHFNPTHSPHAGPTVTPRHLGDIPNIRANAAGTATVDTTIEGASLHDAGVNDLIGRSVIVHEQPDDYTTQPSGNSGTRIGCGVIM